MCILFVAGVILHMELLRIQKTENQTVTAVIVQGMMEQETANAKQTDMAAMDVLSEILADPEQYQKAQEAEYQNVQELLRRYGYSSQESLIRAAEPDKHAMVLRLLLLLAGTYIWSDFWELSERTQQKTVKAFFLHGSDCKGTL